MKKIIVVCSLFVAASAAAEGKPQYCQTEVILKNRTSDQSNVNVLSLTATLQKGTYPSWNPVWDDAPISPRLALNTTMIYPNINGNPPEQFDSQFVVKDAQNGSCTFSPWLIAGCDVVWNWQCSTNAHFKPVFLHLRSNDWRVDDRSPWIISLQNK